jgi:hypothetical protein
MAFKGLSGLRWRHAGWLVLPAGALAVAVGSAHTLFDSVSAARTEERAPAASFVRPAERAPARDATNRKDARVTRDTPRTTVPGPVTTNGVVPASALREFPEFSSIEAEVSFLKTRLPGATLEHANWTRSLASMRSAIEQASSASERAELERRRALLEAKLEQQDALVAHLESRIHELEHAGEFQTGAR